jgi:hypothetical protein
MSQKQQIIPTDMHSQGFKGRGLGNNNNRSGQSQGGGSKIEKPRVNTYTGNTIRTQEQKRKTVFKAVLDSPFNIGWQVSYNNKNNFYKLSFILIHLIYFRPEVSIKDQNEILDALCE